MAIETKNPKDQGIITNKKPYQRKLCDLTIVADHTFFEEVGQKSIDKTVLQMLWHVREPLVILMVRPCSATSWH